MKFKQNDIIVYDSWVLIGSSRNKTLQQKKPSVPFKILNHMLSISRHICSFTTLQAPDSN